jgi:hypothetical protein
MVSRQRQTADTIATSFSKMDIPTLISLRTPTCTRNFLPASLGYPPQTNEQYEAQLNSMATIFTSFAVTVNDVVEDVAGKKIVMFVSARGDTPVGEYRNEYVWKMEFDESGEKVEKWTEFVDVGMARDFYPKLVGEMKRRAVDAAKGGKDS